MPSDSEPHLSRIIPSGNIDVSLSEIIYFVVQNQLVVGLDGAKIRLMYWHELSSPGVDSLDREIPIILPLGSCEQHGRHLPLFVDSLQVTEIASRLEARMPKRVVVAPTLWLGSSHHHLDFPGTISVPPKLYTEMLQSVAKCFLQHGFRRLFFLNGHGGNVIPASQALTDLIVSDERADAACLALSSWWRAAGEAMKPEQHGLETPVLTHACEYETSVMLAIRNDLVHLGEIAADHIERTRPWVAKPRWVGKVDGFHRFYRWTSTGHMGRPEVATREKGLSLLDAITDTLVALIEDFAEWPPMTKMLPADETGSR